MSSQVPSPSPSSSGPDAKGIVGIIGLGIMGGSFARHLLDAGYVVIGCDPVPACSDRFAALGGHPVSAPADVARKARIILTSLPSRGALAEVVSGPEGLRAGGCGETIVVETSTLPVAVKDQARKDLEAVGATLLDCPVSGTGAQAARRDIDIYASGPAEAVARAEPVLQAISRQVHRVGAFGAGMQLKLIANLLVTIHNVAAAEAIVLAERVGLDPVRAVEILRTGAGSSRMFELRGPMMAAGNYEPPTMRLSGYLKDIEAILQLAQQHEAHVPLMTACAPLYRQAVDLAYGDSDTAAVCEAVRAMIGQETT